MGTQATGIFNNPPRFLICSQNQELDFQQILLKYMSSNSLSLNAHQQVQLISLTSKNPVRGSAKMLIIDGIYKNALQVMKY